MSIEQLVAAILLLLGSIVSFSGALGLVRFDNLFARMHVATKPTTLGVTLCLAAAAVAVDGAAATTKLIVAIAFQLIGAPTAAHVLGRAAKRAGVPADGTAATNLDPEGRRS
ncbi:MAG: monovalent cation/H(+) antiporter subunit G [Actinobacteria bacterium]|nr:monovalent cation/H(+) antiporter subunit G [Actinomycetota bacterium]